MPIVWSRKAVAFVAVQHVGDWDLVGAHGIDNLISLLLFHARVVRSWQPQTFSKPSLP